jgi:diadenosine tetraphosphate (Ap4A) HIT family hydrolase
MSTVALFWKMLRNRYRWMPREEWNSLVDGIHCPLCADAAQPETRYGFLVAELETANLHLSKNQSVAGYCVLIHREHATELHQLAPDKQAAFMRDLARAGTAVARVWQPIKMNYQLLGNAIPHLHWHIVPRYWGDPAPGRPLDPGCKMRRLPSDEYRRTIAALRLALA